MDDPIYGTFHDASTGETVTRELTPEEIADLFPDRGGNYLLPPSDPTEV